MASDDIPLAFWRFHPFSASAAASDAGFSDACHSTEPLSLLQIHWLPVTIHKPQTCIFNHITGGGLV